MNVPPATTPDVWIILWPVIVGALLTLLPAIFGQLAVHWLSQSALKRDRDREQFQKLAAGIAEFEIWINAKTDQKAYAGPDPGPSPLPRVMAIASLDFPVLLDALDSVSYAYLGFSKWQNRAAIKRLQGNIAELNDGFSEAYQPLLQQISHLNDELRVVGVSLNH